MRVLLKDDVIVLIPESLPRQVRAEPRGRRCASCDWEPAPNTCGASRQQSHPRRHHGGDLDAHSQGVEATYRPKWMTLGIT